MGGLGTGTSGASNKNIAKDERFTLSHYYERTDYKT